MKELGLQSFVRVRRYRSYKGNYGKVTPNILKRDFKADKPTRPEIKEILETYGMTEYDAFELLKRSGAKLPTDNYEFVK